MNQTIPSQNQPWIDAMMTDTMPELEPIEISGKLPESGAVMAAVWPQEDPEPVVGTERAFIFNGERVMMRVSAVMEPQEGYTGVLVRQAWPTH